MSRKYQVDEDFLYEVAWLTHHLKDGEPDPIAQPHVDYLDRYIVAKLNAVLQRRAYTDSLTAPTVEEREAARQKYIALLNSAPV
jgi:hypothetical protein